MICELFQEGIRVGWTHISCSATQIFALIGLLIVVFGLIAFIVYLLWWFIWANAKLKKLK